ncbi:UNVERIFIED_CONTAM: hypothetical protein Slati_3809900 [Sesamum latifolium]|uniref:Retrotransposon gag domain-containing protein n=1 Tax=Sesamum latifolium TaxID=2727402 RepID=A0AAW2U678_9LAMI
MEIMGVVERPMMEYSFPTADGTISSIVKPSVEANNFEIKPTIFQIIRSSVQFFGLPDEDPNKHLLNFLEICDTFRFNGVSNDATGFQSLPAGSITTWAALTQKFLVKYFPPAKTAKMLNDITSFVQLDRESLYDAWERFKSMLRKYPHHELPVWRQIPGSAKFLKKVLSIKRKWEGGETVKLNEECSAILQNKLPPKLKDLGSFSIPCTIGNIDFDKVLCDLGASVNLMPYSIFEKLGMHELTPSIITLQLADRSIKYPRGIVEDVLVKVEKFLIPVDFIVLGMEEDKNMALILGRPFLATSRALIDVQKGQLILIVNDEQIVFNVFKPMKYLHKKEHAIFAIDSVNTFGTDNVHLVKCEDQKEDCIENSNEDNLQDMKEEHEDIPNFVDTGQEVKLKLQKELLLNGSTSSPQVKPPFEVSSDQKRAREGKWGRPNRMKRWRNQVDENVGFYKEHTKAWNESHMKNKKFKDGGKQHYKNKGPIKVD